MKIKVISFEKNNHSPFEMVIRNYKLQMSTRFAIEERFIRRGDSTNEKLQELLSTYKNSFICILDVYGKTMNTREFTQTLLDIEKAGKTVVFVIGPETGFEKPIKYNFNLLLSLSKMTFSHRIARLLLFEQIYRTYCYITNHPYNK
ncbi:MAG: 23S rRNA (pseudouridine(1915)-N(3))-methyltransferase RlmH [Deltaproteobacteria bacterium]|nr:23S rRNA (pseudouridine(1915)-N(3))-methyltransferase RlmH [Deltaproteobacteria bacterium]